MKEIKSLGIVLNLILAMFSLVLGVGFSITPVYAAENDAVCCGQVGDSYCVFTSPDQCDGPVLSEFSCSQTSECQAGCCIAEEGACLEKMSRAQCVAQKGTFNPTCDIPQCQKGFCVLDQQCRGDVTAIECARLGTQFPQSEVKFDSTVSTEAECRQKYSRDEGCCVEANSCSRTQEKSCTGDFYRGKLCSNQDLIGQCGCQKEETTQCGPGGEDVYYYDSCGNRENVVGVSYDGLVHDSAEDIKNAAGNCDYGAGTICKPQSETKAICESVDCHAGDVYTAESYVPKEGVPLSETYTMTAKDLGGKSLRKHGESWCMASDGAYRNPSDQANKDLPDSPGTTHYQFSCIKGKIEPESCTTFRDGICDTDKGNPEHGFCRPNKWEQCLSCGDQGEGWFPGFDCNKETCEDLGDCVYNDAKLLGKSECWPKYPPGFEFWSSENIESPNARVCSAPDVGCGEGGDSTFNKCDFNECIHLGDCSFDGGWSTIQGVVVGAVVGATVVYVGESLIGIPGVGESAAGGSQGAAAGGAASTVAAKTGEEAAKTLGWKQIGQQTVFAEGARRGFLISTDLIGRSLYGDPVEEDSLLVDTNLLDRQEGETSEDNPLLVDTDLLGDQLPGGEDNPFEK